MSYLLDTCVLSELVKPRPSAGVKQWVDEQSEKSLYVSVLTLAEIQGGVARLPRSKKRSELEIWLHDELIDHFEGRVLPVDTHVAMTWGRLNAGATISGRTLPAMDGMIAATALANDLMLVTRNEADFQATGVEIVNPWS